MTPKEKMIREIKDKYKLDSPQIFSVMLAVPREKFVPKRYKNIAYDDNAVPIGFGQTISQPYTVCFMTCLINPKKRYRILEIGTGSGYQAAILSRLCGKVYSIEIINALYTRAKRTLSFLGYKNIYLRRGSGEYGWKEESPFDAILITASIKGEPPDKLFDQLKNNGVLVAPIDKNGNSVMTKYIKENNRIRKQEFGDFRFVPFVFKKD